MSYDMERGKDGSPTDRSVASADATGRERDAANPIADFKAWQRAAKILEEPPIVFSHPFIEHSMQLPNGDWIAPESMIEACRLSSETSAAFNAFGGVRVYSAIEAAMDEKHPMFERFTVAMQEMMDEAVRIASEDTQAEQSEGEQ